MKHVLQQLCTNH